MSGGPPPVNEGGNVSQQQLQRPQQGAMKNPQQAGLAGPQQVRRDAGGIQQPEAQEFDSWRHQTAHQQQGFNPMSSMASDPYLSSFYAGSYHYPGFGVGDGTWSNGGDHMTFLGNYSGIAAPGAEQVPGQGPYGGQDLGQMFSAGGGFGAFGQVMPAGYGFDFHTAGNQAGYSQWGSTAGQVAGREGAYYRPDGQGVYPAPVEGLEGRGRVAQAEQAMQGLNIQGGQQGGEKENKVDRGGVPSHEKPPQADMGRGPHESNGGPPQASGGGSKKMSWANIASQPAKPLPPPTKNKKPGVLPPPVMVGAAKPNMDIGTWDNTHPPTTNHPPVKNGGVPPVPLAQVITSGPPPLVGAPPPLQGVKVGNPQGGARGQGWPGVAGPRGVRGGPPMSYNQNGNPPPHESHPVLEELRSSNEYNPRDFDLVGQTKNARFFVVKSYSEDDIHRSIKYEIWCSTEHGNKRLDQAFREREGRGPVYLFFSVNGSGHFCGMAQMLNGVDYSASAGVWAQDKWKGQFKVKWIYVKDVPNSQLRHIRLENNENKPVTNSRDTQEVPPEKGKLVLKILHSYKHSTSIFDDFIHYEKRQEEDEVRKPPPEEERRNNSRNNGNDDRGGRNNRREDRGDERGDRRGDRGERGGGVNDILI